MPFSELPLSFLVAFFLGLFVLVGLYPALQRTAVKIRKLLEEAAQKADPLAGLLDDKVIPEPGVTPATLQLDDFEMLVLRRIAQEGDKSLSRQDLTKALLFEKSTLQRTLRKLMQRRLIYLKVSPLLGQRFALSKAGRDYAVAQGLLVHIREH